MRNVLLGVAVLALIGFIVVAVVLPKMSGDESRAAAQALIAGADNAKKQVETAAQKAGKLDGAGQGVKIEPRVDSKHGEMKWLVESNGTIRAWNAKNAIEIAITPSSRDGKTSWSCKGYPIDAMPASCGGS
jgi:hypothetical protein